MLDQPRAGLGSAPEAVAERLPPPVQARAPAQRWDAAVEATAYFVVCEALVNTVKHGTATLAQVRVEPGQGELLVEIVDNGRGGELAILPAEPEPGSRPGSRARSHRRRLNPVPARARP